MERLLSSRPLALALGIAMILGGVVLAGWVVMGASAIFPGSTESVSQGNLDATALPADEESASVDASDADRSAPGRAADGAADRTGKATAKSAGSETASEDPPDEDGSAQDADDARPALPVLIELDPAAARSLGALVQTLAISETDYYTDAALIPADVTPVTVQLDATAAGARPVFSQVYAAATRFDAIAPSLAWQTLETMWRGDDSDYPTVVVLTDTLPALIPLLGKPGADVRGVATVADAVEAAWYVSPTLTLLPFDDLVPSLVVVPIDGQNPIENANSFDLDAYPLVAEIYARDSTRTPEESARAGEFLTRLPVSNRLDERLTVIAMTGVTAMVRGTAAKMDEYGPAWAAEVVGPALSAADITHISNEVPFVPGCETNTNPENLTFCSKPEYMEALEDVGVDIIGLTGNHQNDYGVDDALVSLDIYAEAGLPVYGGGEDRESAMRPLLLEHNGNKLAFLGANSFGPRFAWATEFYPGSAPFDLNILSATIRNLKAKGLADVVLTELQYQERYDVEPLGSQRLDFGALTRAGADIVTGVQSHVPQAVEFVDGHLILYGLGNLFFDQMLEQETREGLIPFHTIYNGRHISTQLRTTLIYDDGQPRWTEPEEHAAILQRVFDASYWEY